MSTARPVSDCEPPVCLSPYTEMGWAGSFCGGPTHSPFLFSVPSVFTYRAQFPLPWLLAADCSYGAQLQGLHNNEQGLWPGVECKIGMCVWRGVLSMCPGPGCRPEQSLLEGAGQGCPRLGQPLGEPVATAYAHPALAQN